MTVKGLLSEELIMERLKDVFDPEIHMSIVELGLVYDVDVEDDGEVIVTYTLTSPGCPAGTEIIDDVKKVAADLEGVTGVEVELVWEPYWTPEKMDPRVRAFLGF